MARPSLHDRLFRALLRLFPSDFRGDFGGEMAADFHQQRRDAARRRRDLVRLWLRTAVDLLRRAPREHLDVLGRDAVYALRTLRRHPAASATAVLSLAIGIGLNTAVYSVVSGVLWRGLPFPESDRLVLVGITTPSEPRPGFLLSLGVRDLQQMRTVDPIAGATLQQLTIVEPGDPAPLPCLAVSARFFDVLGVTPVLGRAFTPGDYATAGLNHPGPNEPLPTPVVALIGDAVWRSQFGGNRDVVGTSFVVAGGARVEVVGVMGPELTALAGALPGRCWVPDGGDLPPQTWRPQIAIGRVAPGHSLEQANAELAIIGASLGPDRFSKEPRALRAAPVLDTIVDVVRAQMLFLLGAVACVLLVTCANIVNLFAAHAAGRRDEVSTRVSLGASRLRLMRQSLTESLVVSLLGGGLGFVLAVVGVPVLLSQAPPGIPRLQQIGVDWSTFAFTLLVSIGIGIVCGLVACLPSRLPRTLCGAVRTERPQTARLRQAVVVAEIGLALMLAVAATLMVRTVRALNSIDLGFDPRAVVAANLPSGNDMRHTQAQHIAIVERVRGLPGVRAAGVGLGPLLGGMGLGGLVVPDDGRVFDVRVDAVSTGYFEALGARLSAGRLFEPRDGVPEGPAVIVVNETAARTFWNGAEAVGKTVVINDNQHLEVIGVIADIRAATLAEVPGPAIYQMSNQTRNFLAGSMLIRTDGDPDALAAAVRSIIRSFDREAPFSGVTPLQARIDRDMAPRIFLLRVLGMFSTLGLVLAAVGVYGVLAEFVGQRVPEFGIRMACGATAQDLLTLVLRHGIRLAAIGLAIGLTGATVLRDVMRTLVYGVQTVDPIAYSTAALVLLAGTIAACALPARRASRLDPVASLRSE